MPQYERRLYEPSDDPRVFDGGDDDLPEDDGSRLPLLIVIALVVLASFAGVVWVAYTQGVQRGREDAPRILAAEEGHPPAATGQETNPYAKLDIYKAPKPAADAPAPASSPPIVPERKVPPASPGVSPSSTTDGQPPPSAGAASTVANNAPAAARPPAARPAMTKPNPAPVPTKSLSAPPPAPRPSSAATNPPRPATGAPKTITPPAAAQPKPMPPPASKPVQAAPSATAPALPSSPVGQGGYVLQIGSYTSEAEANASWQTYKQSHPAVAGYSPDIKSADLGRRGTWYRLRIGPFASLSEASAACARLKAQGASCLPAKQ